MSDATLRIKTLYDFDRTEILRPSMHPLICVTFADGPEQIFCGDSWCTGGCGHPALVIGNEKAHSSMVAMGPVMNRFRVDWTGSRVEVPAEFVDEIRRRWWR